MISKTVNSKIKDWHQELLNYGNSLSSQKFTISEFTALIRKLIGTSNIKVKTSRDKEVERNQVVIGGCYDPDEDEAGVTPITIYATYHPQQKRIYIKDVDWNQLCIDLIECTGHELVHQTQYRSRGFDIGPNIFVSLSTVDKKRLDQEYLGSTDEVEAYGYSIAVEVLLKYSPKVISSRHISKCAVFKNYVSAFGADHKVVRSLTSFVVQYYETLTEGKHAKDSQELV